MFWEFLFPFSKIIILPKLLFTGAEPDDFYCRNPEGIEPVESTTDRCLQWVNGSTGTYQTEQCTMGYVYHGGVTSVVTDVSLVRKKILYNSIGACLGTPRKPPFLV